MSYHAIVAVASGGVEDARVLGVAARLAALHGALVRVVPAFPDPAADLVYYGVALSQATGEIAERMAESERVAHETLETQAAACAAREGLSRDPNARGPAIVVEHRALQPAVALTRAAVLADLIVFGACAVRETAALRGLYAEMMLSARAPILLVKGEGVEASAVAVAWDGSAQAGRAMRAAAPLLQAARRVVLIQNISDHADEVTDPAFPMTYLSRMGVRDVGARKVRGERVSESLLEAAREDGCDVLVAGAYGRPRLYELILGGTTRALTNAEAKPHILFAH